MSLSLKELSNLLGFLQEEEIGNQTFDSYSSAFQKAGFSKQVNNFTYYIFFRPIFPFQGSRFNCFF